MVKADVGYFAADLNYLVPNELPSIEHLISQHRYAEAINLLEREARAQKSSAAKPFIEALKKEAASYDREQASAARQAANQGHWELAFRILGAALSSFPEGMRLQQVQHALHPQQQRQLRELDLKLLFTRAEWLLESRPLREEMVNTDPGNRLAVIELERTQNEMMLTATQLSNIGIQALADNDLGTAERCLTVADRLHPIAENILALEKLDRVRYERNLGERKQRLKEEQKRTRAESERRRHTQRAEGERQQQESLRLTEDIRSATAKGELLRAQEALAQLETFDRNHSQLRYLQQTLGTAVAAKVNDLVEKGNAFYSSGDIEVAKEVWEEALMLSPDNAQLRGRIARAEQVLQNLRAQQKKVPVPN